MAQKELLFLESLRLANGLSDNKLCELAEFLRIEQHMKVTLRHIEGPWDDGWVLDKHSLHSVCIGHDEFGYARYDTTRSEVGEATFQLKYRSDWTQVQPLALAIAEHAYPMLGKVGFIVPMPASRQRPRQPVTELAIELGRLVGVPVFGNLLLKAANGKSLKDIGTKAEKIEAIRDSFSVNDEIEGSGPWDVLVVDDLFDTGASMEAACTVLRAYPKVRKIYVVALTWR